MMGRFRHFADHLICWLVVVFLLAGPHIANALKDLTRYLHFWTRMDAVLLLASLGLIASTLALAGCLIAKIPRQLPTRIFEHFFVIALGAGFLANLCFHLQRSEGFHLEPGSMEMQTAWLLLFAVAGYSFARPASKLPLRARQCCQILSPAVVIVAIQLLRACPYASPLIPITSPTALGISPAGNTTQPANVPVFIFVMDEWSYDRTFEDGRSKSEFANLTALCQEATFFTDAHSPGEETSISLPRLLYQTDKTVTIHDGRVGFGQGAEFIDSTSFSSLFSQAASGGYRTFMLGFFLPYRVWLGPQVDVCRSYRWYPHGDHLSTALAQHTFDSAAYWTDPWSMWGYVKIKTAVKDRAVLHIYDSLQRDVSELIRLPRHDTFAVVHFPLPHEPYILNEDGQYRGPSHQQWVRPDVEGYTRNLRRLDRQIGQWIAELKSQGKYESALLAFTSDHTWRFDPQRPSEAASAEVLTHVPLIVKRPHQNKPIVIRERFENRQLQSLLESALTPNVAQRKQPSATDNTTTDLFSAQKSPSATDGK